MSDKSIEFEDIRVGDKIQVVYKEMVEVRSIDDNTINNIYTKKSYDKTLTKSFELLERPLPKIPDTVGSVIEVKGGRYVLVHNDYLPTDMWTNVKTGYYHAPERMRGMVEDAEGFEVIA